MGRTCLEIGILSNSHADLVTSHVWAGPAASRRLRAGTRTAVRKKTAAAPSGPPQTLGANGRRRRDSNRPRRRRVRGPRWCLGRARRSQLPSAPGLSQTGAPWPGCFVSPPHPRSGAGRQAVCILVVVAPGSAEACLGWPGRFSAGSAQGSAAGGGPAPAPGLPGRGRDTRCLSRRLRRYARGAGASAPRFLHPPPPPAPRPRPDHPQRPAPLERRLRRAFGLARYLCRVATLSPTRGAARAASPGPAPPRRRRGEAPSP